MVSMNGPVEVVEMRFALALAVLVSTSPVSAACRLSPADCTTLLHEMSAEFEASADDERNFRPGGLSRFERAVALSRRHLDRVDERSILLPDRVAREWTRIDACAEANDARDPGCR